MKSLSSLPGVMFLVVVAVLASVPDWRARSIAGVMLTLAALKLAQRAMKVGEDTIEFPELSADELFDARAIVPSIVFSLVFLMAPLALLTFAMGERGAEEQADAASEDGDEAHPGDEDLADADAAAVDDDEQAGADDALAQARAAAAREAAARSSAIDDDEPAPRTKSSTTKRSSMSRGQVGAMAGALFLIVFAPMALVMYLRTATTFALFFVPQGLSAIAADVRGYFLLCALVWPAFLGVLVCDAMSAALPFYLDPLAQLPRSALVLLAWGLCGLYVRSRARAFDLPIDDDDWVMHAATSPPAATTAPPRVRPASVSLHGDDDPPVVAGKLIE